VVHGLLLKARKEVRKFKKIEEIEPEPEAEAKCKDTEVEDL
jgi:hypothetical protein